MLLKGSQNKAIDFNFNLSVSAVNKCWLQFTVNWKVMQSIRKGLQCHLLPGHPKGCTFSTALERSKKYHVCFLGIVNWKGLCFSVFFRTLASKGKNPNLLPTHQFNKMSKTHRITWACGFDSIIIPYNFNSLWFYCPQKAITYWSENNSSIAFVGQHHNTLTTLKLKLVCISSCAKVIKALWDNLFFFQKVNRWQHSFVFN